MSGKKHFEYMMAGLHISSEIRLPELIPAGALSSTPDVQILFASTPTNLPGSDRPIFEAEVTKNEVLLTIPGVARYHIKNGTSIFIDPEPNVAERNIRLFLLGSAMGAICLQKGLFPLHASVVVINGNAIAFCGDSGEGKSTTAAWLNTQGYPLMCDDVCTIHIDEQNNAIAYPSFPRIKLWKDSLAAFSIDHTNLTRDLYRLDKFQLPVGQKFWEKPAHLTHIFMLEFSDDNLPPRLEPISPAQRVAYLRSSTYRYEFISHLGLTIQHFENCVQLAGRIKFSKLARPRNFELMNFSQELIEKELM